MIELALLLGLGAVGYMLVVKNSENPASEGFESSITPRPTEEHSDGVVHSQATVGHNNETPFFGARVTQSMYSGATDGILDNHVGAGKEYFQKREVQSMFDSKAGVGNPFGNQNESDFMQSRMVSGQNMKNVFPVEQVHVGPGTNDGYTDKPSGGYQQDALRDYMLPPTTDEMRVVTNPKLSYELEPTPGVAHITQPGIQAPVVKNKPDKFAVFKGTEHFNTAVGAQTATRVYPEQPMKTQARETTEIGWFNGAGGSTAVINSYIRAFTEPYQEFMKLTTEGRPGPAGTAGMGTSVGADQYVAQTKRDESVLADATRINPPMQIINSSMEHLGSYRYNEPLQQDIHVERNHPSILDAHRSNPYAQKLNAF